LKNIFKQYAINVAILINKLPRTPVNSAYGNQEIRASSSAGANYRAACRAKSKNDFINKLKIVEEETDESVYFLELLLFFNQEYKSEFEPLIKEGNELLAITVASLGTAGGNNANNSNDE
jgi:four helix bundle protein